jgi:hypothetical protein
VKANKEADNEVNTDTSDDALRKQEAHSGECKNYKEDRDYQKEVNSWCFWAHQLCCFSAKKFDRWRNFCHYYGFEDPGKQAESSTEHDPSALTTVDCTVWGDSNCDADETNLHQAVEHNAKISVVIHCL